MVEPDDLTRFKAAVLPHLDAAYNLARWLARDPDAAQDIVQEATLRALRFFASYRGGDARPWYLRIVRNTFLSSRTRDGDAVVIPMSAFEREDGRSGLDDIAGPDDDPETALARLEDRSEVDRLIARLPPEFREVIVLRELEELSYKEIALIAEIPIGTVMSRLARARGLLAAWAREGPGEEVRHAV